MHACSCFTGVAKLLLEYGAGINTHSNEFKESALTLACYKGVYCIHTHAQNYYGEILHE